jgi:uncharacterized repeat protein (TIGR03803 family)
MKKLLFTLFASVAVIALVPATALARGDHHRHHHGRAHHSRVRHARFGSDQSQPTGTGAAQDAGTVQSFDSGGKLTVLLNDGSTVTGRVTDATEMECETAEADQMNGESQRRGDEGDRSGSRDNGDNGDRGDNGDDQGDEGATCSTADLMPGAVVREAELTISSGSGAVWTKLELDLQRS